MSTADPPPRSYACFYGLPYSSILRLPDLGTLAPGAAGEATLFVIEDRDFVLTDCFDTSIAASPRFAPRGTVVGGAWCDR